MQLEILAQIFQRNIRAARAAHRLRIAHFEVAQNLARRFVKLRHGDEICRARRHECSVRRLGEHFCVGKNPDVVRAPGARGVERVPRTVGSHPRHVRIQHDAGHGIVIANLPNTIRVRGAETDFGEMRFGFWIIFQLNVARKDFFRPIRAARHDNFVHRKINSTRRDADYKIRRAQSPQADARRAQRGEFVMARMLRERVKEREQQGDGQHENQKARHHRGGVFREARAPRPGASRHRPAALRRAVRRRDMARCHVLSARAHTLTSSLCLRPRP